jgi:hypothetical protein
MSSPVPEVTGAVGGVNKMPAQLTLKLGAQDICELPHVS